MTESTKSLVGYFKANGQKSQAKPMEIQTQVHHEKWRPESEGEFFFKDEGERFRIGKHFMGITVRVFAEMDRASLDGLEEASITLTLHQAEDLVDQLRNNLDDLRTISREIEKQSTA